MVEAEAVSPVLNDASGAVTEGPALTDLTPRRVPFSEQPKGEKKKRIRMQTSNQLKQVVSPSPRGSLP